MEAPLVLVPLFRCKVLIDLPHSNINICSVVVLVIVVCSNFYNLAAGMSQGHVTFFLIIKDDIHAQLTFNV